MGIDDKFLFSRMSTCSEQGGTIRERNAPVTICGSAGRGADTYLRLPNI